MIKLLIEYGADVNVKDAHGDSLLNNLIVNNNIELINLLLQNNADVDTRDNDGRTPLMRDQCLDIMI